MIVILLRGPAVCDRLKYFASLYIISLYLLNEFLKEKSQSNIFQNQSIWQKVGFHLTKKIWTTLKPGVTLLQDVFLLNIVHIMWP